MMWFLLLLSGPSLVHQQRLDDEILTVTDEALTYPSSAVIIDGRLFVSDSGVDRIFVLEQDGRLTSFSGPGSGPGLFPHSPLHLRHRDGLLEVTLLNRLGRLRFKPNGDFLDASRPDRKLYEIGVKRIKRVPIREALASGRYWSDLDDGCRFGAFERDDYLSHHQARSILVLADDYLLSVRRSGVLEVFTSPCRRVVELPLGIAVHAMEPTVDKLAMSVARSMGSENGYIQHKGGRPVIDAAARDAHTLWVLVQDEHDQSRHLLTVDPLGVRIMKKTALPLDYNQIHYSEDRLILLSTTDAVVDVFSVSQ